MTTRSFEFADGKSDKFWTIALDGKQFTVQFGRRGTNGQTQAKDFASADAAREAFDKLVGEKLKKGYSEVGAAAPPVAPAAKAAVTNGDAPPAKSRVTDDKIRSSVLLHLSPADWMMATWRPRQPVAKPPIRPFDRETAMELYRRWLEIATKGQYWWPGWSKMDLPANMSPEEARFWIHAILGLMPILYLKNPNAWTMGNSMQHRTLADQTNKQLLALDLSRELPLRGALKLIGESKPSYLLLVPLLNLYPVSESADALADLACRSDWSDLGRDGLRDHLQYLSNEEWELLGDALRRRLPAQTPSAKCAAGARYEAAPDIFRVAAAMGGGVDLTRLIEGWPDVSYHAFQYMRWPQDLVFGLPSAALVSHHMRRLKYPLKTARHIRAWLAHTELAELDLIRDSILETGNREEAAELADAFAVAVTAAEAAPAMLAIAVESRAPQAGRKWLVEHPEAAIAGLAPVAAGKGKLADAAIEALRDLDRAGHGAMLESQLTAAAFQKVTAYKAIAAEAQEVLDAGSTPAGLAAAFAEGGKIKAKAPVWAVPALLPPIVMAGGRLNDEQIATVVRALVKSDLAVPHPLLLALRCYATPASLDRFVWALFERWLADGAPSKEKWALGAVGVYGGDQSAISLAGLIRVWPGQGKHQLAVMGLECLRTIGTDTALIQISGISQRVKFQAIKARAKECMEEIAADLHLTRAQLEDRVVPDCGLDENGSRIFDFGPRQFRLILGAGLKPLVVDADNQRKPDLPKPNSKDDAAKAEEAVAAWKLVKKQLAEVVKVQTRRLEQALVTQRRWTVAEFESLFLRHPFLMNMAPWLVWGAYDRDGKVAATFRVTEDRSLGDEHDSPVTLPPDVTVGLVHPMQLSEVSLAAWGELFSDYEILPPFPQLGRPVLRLTAKEAAGDTIQRHEEASIPPAALVGTLERLGWQRAAVADGGAYDFHGKEFPEAGITAILEHDMIFIGMLTESEPISINACYFTAGGFDRGGWGHSNKKLPLRKIDPLIVSEVLSDLETVASKGTE